MFDSPVAILLIGIFGLLGIGLYGLMVCHNLLKVIVALQIMLKGAEIAFLLAGAVIGQLNLAQSLIVTVIAVDTVVAVVGLALGIQAKRLFGTLDLRQFSSLRG